jgi:hypothetical protein
MSFLRKLFGLSAPSAPQAEASVEHEGYTIVPAPMSEGGQYRLVAIIRKEIGGEMREHRMVRADVFSSRDEAIEAAIRKAKLVIKEQGDRLFG